MIGLLVVCRPLNCESGQVGGLFLHRPDYFCTLGVYMYCTWAIRFPLSRAAVVGVGGGGRGLATRPRGARKLPKTSHPIKREGNHHRPHLPHLFPQIGSPPLSLPHRLPLVSIAPPLHLLAQLHRLPLSGGFS